MFFSLKWKFLFQIRFLNKKCCILFFFSIAPNAQPSLFGGQQQQQKPLFGASTSPGTSGLFGQANGAGLFGQAQSQQQAAKPLFGAGTAPFGQTQLQMAPNVQTQLGADASALAAQNALLQQQLASLWNSPYGDASYVKSLLPKRDPQSAPTNRHRQQEALHSQITRRQNLVCWEIHKINHFYQNQT